GSAADHDSRLQLGLRDLRGLAAAGKLDKAEQLARKLVAKFPGSHIALHELTRVLVLLNRHAESLPIALKALALQPTQAECYAAVAMGLRYCKQPWLSRHLLEMTLRVHPNCSTGWDMLGLSYVDLNLVSLGVKCIEKGLHLDPRSVEKLNNLARVYSMQMRLEESLS